MKPAAVVTGAASGIGRKAAERLLRQGWRVWGMDLQLAPLKEAFAQAEGAGDFTPVRCDVSSAEDVARAFAEVAAATQGLQALVCCAGTIRIGALEENEPADVDRMLGVNVKGPWLCVRAALGLLRHGASQEAPNRVVIVGSVSGLRPKVGSGMYAATKAAVHVLAGVMAVELAPSGVVVNVIAPGTTDTPMIESMSRMKSSVPFKLSGVSPLGRIATPDDIADVMEFLLSPASAYLNGVVIPVDGGSRAAHGG